MNLDWCSNENLLNTQNFNEYTIIDKEKKKSNLEKVPEEITNNVNVQNCFNLNLNIKNNQELLNILTYLSLVSNHLRLLIRNKSTKFNEYKIINEIEFESINKYLEWLYLSSSSIKKYFSVSSRKDNSYDPNTIKLFKTSSYKFCNYKESCSIHKNKNNKCDKNHFVFDMIINDIFKLIESIKIIGIENMNWILSNKIIKVTYFIEEKNYIVEKINDIDISNELNSNQFIIDKNLIFKSFDVVSYVFNKMFEELKYFINCNIHSYLINLN